MSTCISNKECGKGFCRMGQCASYLFTGDPCLPGKCGLDTNCHKEIGRCVDDDYKGKAWKTGLGCSYNDYCRKGKYCYEGKCLDAKTVGESCSSSSWDKHECADGLSCVNKKCVKRCRTINDCGDPLGTCERDMGEDYKTCHPRAAKPDEAVPPPVTTNHPDTTGSRGNGEDTLAQIGGAVIVFLIITAVMGIIVFLVRRRRRNRRNNIISQPFAQFSTPMAPNPSPSQPLDAPPAYHEYSQSSSFANEPSEKSGGKA